MADETNPTAVNSIELATQLTIAWLNNPSVKTTAEDVPTFLKAIHATIGELSTAGDTAGADAAPEHKPAVPVRSSVKSDFITSLIDGRKLKSLKRHLSMHGLTPKEYRERYGLKADYPMVAPNYSAQRREVAKKLGLGRKPKAVAAAAAPAASTSAPAAAAVAPKVKVAPKPKAAPKTQVAKAPKPAAAPEAAAPAPTTTAAPKPVAAPKPKAAPKAKAAPKLKAAPKAPKPAAAAAPKPAKAPKPAAVPKPAVAAAPKAATGAAPAAKPGRPKKVDTPAS